MVITSAFLNHQSQSYGPLILPSTDLFIIMCSLQMFLVRRDSHEEALSISEVYIQIGSPHFILLCLHVSIGFDSTAILVSESKISYYSISRDILDWTHCKGSSLKFSGIFIPGWEHREQKIARSPSPGVSSVSWPNPDRFSTWMSFHSLEAVMSSRYRF